MRDAALSGDGVNLLDHHVDAADFHHLILVTNPCGNGTGRNKQPGTRLTKGFHQSAVVKLAHNMRAQSIGIQPVDQLGAYRGVFAGQQKWLLVEHGRKVSLEFFRQCPRGKDRLSALSQQMTVTPHIEIGRHRPVGNNHIEAMHRQLGQQRGQAAFTADQPYWFFKLQRWLHQLVGHPFRHRIGNADPKRHRLDGGLIAQDVEQLIADTENFFGITDNASSGIGQFHIAADAAEQIDTQHMLKFTQLAADRLRCQMQLRCCPGDTAGLGDHPEISQMFKIQAGHL